MIAGLVCLYKALIECHVQVWNVWMLILFFLLNENVILYAIQVGVQICLNMIWSSRSADSGQIVHLVIFLDDLQLQIIESIPPKHL